MFCAVLVPDYVATRGIPDKFFLGVNYPWSRYGQDFGTNSWGHVGVSEPDSKKKVDDDFAYLQSKGVHIIRWFVFCDMRAGVKFADDGTVIGLDDYVFKDMDAALDLAAKHNIRIIFVLFDFNLFEKQQIVNGVKMGGRFALVEDGQKREELIQNVVEPMLKRYGRRKEIMAWEVINEPEWVMRINRHPMLDDLLPPRPVHLVDKQTMIGFVAEVAREVHAYTKQAATVGSAQGKWLTMWTNCSLDFLQVHFYKHLRPLSVKPAALYHAGVPVIVGEFPSKGPLGDLPDFLDAFRKNGYNGSFVWSLNATDKYTDFRGHVDQWTNWAYQHRKEIAP